VHSRRMAVRSLVVLAVVLAAAGLAAPAAPSGADVVTPARACRGAGYWAQARFGERTVDLETDDVVDIPLDDVVRWTGRVGEAKPGDTTERRSVSGRIELELPLGQSRLVNDWGGTSVKEATEGRHKYDLPFFFKGVKMKLSGHHDEDGRRVCSGSVYVQVEGSALSNPLTWAGIVGVVLSLLALVWAGRGRHPIGGALAGLVFGGAIGGLLLMFAVIPLDSVVLLIAPIVGLVLGIVWGWSAPLRRRGPGRQEPPQGATTVDV
jgi:hypothetical protein